MNAVSIATLGLCCIGIAVCLVMFVRNKLVYEYRLSLLIRIRNRVMIMAAAGKHPGYLMDRFDGLSYDRMLWSVWKWRWTLKDFGLTEEMFKEGD